MIINIPLQIDEVNIEKAMSTEYERRVTDEITNRIVAVLQSKAPYYTKWDPKEGMKVIVQDEVDKYIDQYKYEICEIAGKCLAERLAKTKRGKELLEEVANDKS